MPRLISLICFIFLAAKCFAFEGTLTFVIESPFDTILYNYTINNNFIRIEEKASNEKQIRQIVIYNRKNKIINILSPERKQYVTISYTPFDLQKQNNTFEIYPSTNYKIINNKRCMQWRVKNKEKQTEVVYWLSSGDYEFLSDFMNNQRRTDNIREFFVHIPNNTKYLPMLAEERTLTRELKHRLMVTSINPKHYDDSFFTIPSDYHQVEL